MSLRRRELLALLAASAAFRHGVAMAAPAPLPDWSSTQLQLWNWSNPFAPSEWGEDKLGDYAWKAANARIVDGALELAVTEKASGQIQANADAGSTKATWEVDVTLPEMRPGLVAAPLWLFNKDANEEIDFEIVGERGLQLNVFADVNGEHRSVWLRWVIAENLSGRRFRLGLDYEAAKRIAFTVDGETVAVVTPDDTEGGAFPKTALRPYLDLWVAAGSVMDPRWAGQWTPMAPDESRVMTVHGYKRS